MSHKSRNIANSRYEAQRIYYQRKEINRLIQEKEKFRLRCFKALKFIRDNYGVLDKYEIDVLDDILNGIDN